METRIIATPGPGTRHAAFSPMAAAVLRPETARTAVAASQPVLAHQGRGAANMALADRIATASRAALVQREDVTPDFEPDNQSLGNAEQESDDDEVDPVAEDLEPFDATIESAALPGVARVTVEGDHTSVTITAEPGEIITVVTEDNGHIEVEVEDEVDVLLSP